MQKQTETKRDPEAVLLARVYALILTWGEGEAQTPRADAANARTPRKPKTKKQTEGNGNG